MTELLNTSLKEDHTSWLLELTDLFKSEVLSMEDLRFIEGSVKLAIFQRENDCSDEEFSAWQEANRVGGKFFKISLSQFREDTERYVKELIETKQDSFLKVSVFGEEILLAHFERYWRFLVNARVNYIGLDVFENRRIQLHQKIFKQIGLDRVADRETKKGREILRICDLLERSDNSAFEEELKKILKKLRFEGILIESK